MHHVSVIPEAGEFDRTQYEDLDSFETILSPDDVPF